VAAADPCSPRDRAVGVAFISVIGGLAGVTLTARGGRRTRWVGALTAGAVLAGSETIARRMQRPGEIPSLWHRILTTSAMAAPLGGWPNG
jgi:hypothetical protein